VTSASKTANDIASRLTIHAGSGTGDQLLLDDSGDSHGNVAAVTPVAITGLGMGSSNQAVLTPSRGLVYDQFEQLEMRLGNQHDDLRIINTLATVTTTIHTFGGNDTIHIDDTEGTLEVDGGAGEDQFFVRDIHATTTLKGDIDDDHFWVNYTDSDPNHFTSTASQTNQNGIHGNTLNLHGEWGSDEYTIGQQRKCDYQCDRYSGWRPQ